MAANSAGCKCKRSANHGGAAGFRETPPSHQDQKEIKALKQDLRRKEKALAEAAALLITAKKIKAFWGEDGDD